MSKSSRKIATAFVVAAAAAVAACIAGKSSKSNPASISGERIVGDVGIDRIAKLEIGDKTKTVLSAGENGWIVESMQNYPADKPKIVENLLKLQELKAGQIVRGKKLSTRIPVVGKDASGKELFSVVLGEKHEKWGLGRYAEYKGQAVLTGDGLDAFDGDSKAWCDTKIVDTPWISFKDLAEKGIDDSITGLSTGITAKVTIAGDTNRVATIGTTVKGGTDRYMKLDGRDWVFIVPSYSVESLLPKPPKPEESKKEKEEKKVEEKKAAAGAVEKGGAAAATAEKTGSAPKSKVEPASEPVAEPAAKPAANSAPKSAAPAKQPEAPAVK